MGTLGGTPSSAWWVSGKASWAKSQGVSKNSPRKRRYSRWREWQKLRHRGESRKSPKQLKVAGGQSLGHAGVKFLARGVEFRGRVPEGRTYRVGADGGCGY